MGNTGNKLSLLFSPNGLLFLALCFMLVNQLLPGGFSIYSSWLFSIWLLLDTRVNKRMDKTATAVLVFGLFFGVIPVLKGNIDIPRLFYYSVSPVFFYFYGRHVGRICREETDYYDFFLAVILCFSSFIYVQTVQNLFSGGSILLDERSIKVENIEMAATAIGLYVCLGFIGLPFLLYHKTVITRKSIYAIVFILSLLTVISLVNRAGILVALALLLFATLYNSRGKKIHIIGSLVLFVVLALLLQQIGLLSSDVIDAYSNRTDDLSTGGSRFERWQDAWGLLWRAPFGWTSPYYVHNMWLDVAKVAGLIPFLALAIATFHSIRLTWRVVKKAPSSMALFFLCIQTCFFISCFGEPVFQAVPILGFLYFIFWGVQEGYCKKYGIV